MNVRDVPLSLIDVPEDRRAVDRAKAAQMSQSIEHSGLLQPIGLLPVGPRYTLIYGAHRKEAVAMLGWETIPAVVHQGDAHAVALMEIDENLIRKALTPLEEGEHLKRRKAIYEAIHPETKRGGAPGKAGGGKLAKDDKLASFAADTAEKTGRSARSVQRDVAVADGISEAARTQIVGTKVADNRAELGRLAAIADEDQQLEVAKLIGAGKAANVTAAAAMVGSVKGEGGRVKEAEVRPAEQKPAEKPPKYDWRSEVAALEQQGRAAIDRCPSRHRDRLARLFASLAAAAREEMALV